MLLLAFDTATSAITVAVHDGVRVLGEARGEGSMAHGELLAPAIVETLADAGKTMADLTDVAVGVGPGPFTSLRVGVVTALTLEQTLGLTAHGVCSLDILAGEVPKGREFLVATDARRNEVYWAHYDAAGNRIDGPHVSGPAHLAALHPQLAVYGRGGQIYAEVLKAADGPTEPSAAVLADLVVTGKSEEFELAPLYLRRPDATPQLVPKFA